MDRIKRIFFPIHILGSFFVFVFFNWVFYGESEPNPLRMAILLTLASLIAFYSHYFLLKRFFNKRKYWFYVIGLILVILITPFLYSTVLIDLEGLKFIVRLFTLSLFTLANIITSSIVVGTENWIINIFKRQELEKQNITAELSYLKSQINPHFLFNTLNNIHTLAYKQSPKTPASIMMLSDMMRYMLYDSNARTVPLSSEINYMKDYISLQQLRYKAESIVVLNVIGDIETCHVAPLLFIHLLENAYKHSHVNLKNGDIQINIDAKEDSLLFTIKNPVGKDKQNTIDEPGGIGLANVQKRLQLIYPDRHTFEIYSGQGFFSVILKIDHLQTK